MTATAVQVEVKEKPLILSNAEVRALLAGHKTQKRVAIKHKIEADMKFAHEDGGGNWIFWSGLVAADMAAFTKTAYPNGEGIPCPFGKRGTRLWVREAPRCDDRGMFYAADETPVDKSLIPDTLKRIAGFCDPFHMPRWASRITLEITNIRVERLREITVEDIVAEGVQPVSGKVYSRGCGVYVDEWIDGWDKLNAKRGYSWELNPWVWVIEFKRV